MKGNDMPKNLTPSVFTFQNLIRGNFLYVDKTEYLWKLVQNPSGSYFLSRPRRFGKSLTLSTLEAIFQGRRELFQGCAIYDKPYDWKKYPVIHLSFADCSATSPEELQKYLANQLEFACQDAKVTVAIDPGQLGGTFEALIRCLGEQNPVVILIDEYDKPLLNTLGELTRSQALLAVMKGFYAAIKKCEALERFVFLTGVTKFCHVSLFSDLNNLQDISTNPDYATMLGYTLAELENNFGEWLSLAEKSLKISYADLLHDLKFWYDGYRFASEAETVFNPVSIVYFFLNGGIFENYWYTTGTTTSLFQLLKHGDTILPEMLEETVWGELFDSFELEQVDVQKLMYQTGYLTIGETERVSVPGTKAKLCRYHLRFPNFEVRSSFCNQVMEHFANCRRNGTFELIQGLAADINHGDVDGFLERIKILLARVPYNIHGRQEHDYQTILFVIFMMLNQVVEGEHHTSDGRADIVLHTAEWTYVMEFKLNQSAQVALEQIHHKDYARGFLGNGRRVLAVGVNFDSEKGQLSDWEKEEIL